MPAQNKINKVMYWTLREISGCICDNEGELDEN